MRTPQTNAPPASKLAGDDAIGTALRDLYDDATKEAVPQELLDILDKLD